ncbi:MAG: isoprenylcysteine carboxylmethyltransferase family protein [Bacteroidales bacterium]
MRINIMQLIICFSFVFAFSELLLMLFKHSRIKTAKTRKDQGSMILIWAMITFGFIGGFNLAKHDSWHSINSVVAGIGLMIVLTGIVIRWLAIIQLGKSFTVDVAITEVAKLKTDGLYKKVRHPSYLGLLLIIIGFSATMNSIYSLLILTIPVSLAILYRISVEEKVLIQEFGNRYSEYKSQSKKLIPGIY